MKLITWNCNMAFRNKAEFILKHKPDILVVPECERPDKFLFARKKLQSKDAVWFGNNPNKGLGVFSYGDCKLRLLDTHNDKLKIILPIEVSGAIDFTLFAIWANNPGDPDGAYVEQTWKALDHYAPLLQSTRTVLMGDFNSNTIWDRPRRIGNHSHVVSRLAEKNIQSCYHLHHRQEQGKEKHPTQFMYRHKDKPYHLDYCFASADMTARLQNVQVGRHSYWSQFSDHVPVIVSFKDF
jgi:exodeoxyribonuclease-3